MGLKFTALGNCTQSVARIYINNGTDPTTATTGQPAAAQAWATALGAGVAPGDGGIDHSTSLFVIGPDAHLAGVLLRPGSVAGLAADLRALQAARQAASQTAGS